MSFSMGRGLSTKYRKEPYQVGGKDVYRYLKFDEREQKFRKAEEVFGAIFGVEPTVQDAKDVASFVVPVGATINMDGTAIMQGMATVFIAQMSGIDLSIFQYVQVVLLAVVASIGAAAVPSAGTITLVIILQQFGLPLEAIGIILAVDRILDMIRTSVNVCGDAAVSCIVASSEEELDKQIFNS